MTDSDPTKQDSAPVLDGTLKEHEHCMRLVSDLSGWLDLDPAAVSDWSAQLQARLSALAKGMQEHFEGEEQSPIYRELPTETPRFADQLDRLKAEHLPMLSDIDALVEMGGEIDPNTKDLNTGSIRELKARIKLLIATMRRHEAEENEIIMSAHWDDLGGND